MKHLEIQSITNLPDGTSHQSIYVLDNGGGRIMKFVCRISIGEKIKDTIKKANNWIATNGTNVKYNDYQQQFAH
jgi:hypothetical protein